MAVLNDYAQYRSNVKWSRFIWATFSCH